LLEILHEDHFGVATLFVANFHEGNTYKRRYQDMFPGEKPPAIRVGGSSTSLIGQDSIYVDGFGRFDSDFRNRCYENPFVVVKGID
jgi:hypothetical protein